MRKKKIFQFKKKMWDVFEKTGCISAYILYKEFNKKTAKNKKIKIVKN